MELRADAVITVNISLKPGKATETVTVSADSVQIDVTTGTLSQVIGTSQVSDLPLNGRNASALTEEVAGVTFAPGGQADQGNTKTFPSAVTISANGTFVGQTNYMLDGGNNVDEYTNVNEPFPMPDALQEFSVETSNYNAQYGQNAGGVVNIITKSGTNQYHGDAFEFVRNRAFNAANPFTYSTAINAKVVDPLHRNQFGGTVGGPLEIPHLLHSDKSFGFLVISGRSIMRPPLPDPPLSFCRQSPRPARTRRAERREATTWYLPRASAILLILTEPALWLPMRLAPTSRLTQLRTRGSRLP